MSFIRRNAALLVAGSLAMILPLPVLATGPDAPAGDALLRSLAATGTARDSVSPPTAATLALTGVQPGDLLAALADVPLRDTGTLSPAAPPSALLSALTAAYATDGRTLSQMTAAEPGNALLSALSDTFAADTGRLTQATAAEPGNALLSALSDTFGAGGGPLSRTAVADPETPLLSTLTGTFSADAGWLSRTVTDDPQTSILTVLAGAYGAEDRAVEDSRPRWTNPIPAPKKR